MINVGIHNTDLYKLSDLSLESLPNFYVSLQRMLRLRIFI